MPPDCFIGWDIGGAHLKAAVINNNAEVAAIHQLPCELWKGLDRLEQAAGEIIALLPKSDCYHALTMTGELADLFSGRQEGVRRILSSMLQLLPRDRLRVYAGHSGLLPANRVEYSHYSQIASANWLASAQWVARQLEHGLLVDIGSTTTDILAIAGGQVRVQGYTDYDRLVSRELVYSGIIRTPVMAVAASINDKGREVPLMAEHFATMADVYRLTGELRESHDQAPAADGAEKTIPASAKRLARMLGCDYFDNELPRWLDLAHELKKQQLAMIKNACEHHFVRIAKPEAGALVGAGVGRFLVEPIAQELGSPYRDFSEFFTPSSNDENGFSPADCAPAAAIAGLAMIEAGKKGF